MISDKKRLLLINLWPGSTMHYTIQYTDRMKNEYNVFVLLSESCDSSLFSEGIELQKIKTGIPKRYSNIFHYINLINPFYYFVILFQVLKQRADNIVVIFFHPYLAPIFLLFRNVWFIYHDPEGHLGERNLLLHYLQRFCSYRASRVFVHSKSLIPKNIPPSQRKKYRIIKHGNFDFLTKLGNPDLKPQNQILFVGRFVKYKGIEYLIRTFAKIQDDYPDWKLVIKGSGDPYFALELKSINPEQLIFENRYLSDSELADTVRRCKVMVLPYIDGSQSGVIALAEAFQKPVLITSIGTIEAQCENLNYISMKNSKDTNGMSMDLKEFICKNKGVNYEKKSSL